MNRDRSLDEFGPDADGPGSDGATGEADASDATRATDGPGADPDGTGSADDADDGVAPAESTYAWSPDGVCAVCGGTAPTRWRQDGAYVCPDCKEW